jgi:ATP-binding cassette subfamily F protein 3
MLRRPNLLVLDEPTNHLDMEGREALQQSLQRYPGTLLFVSHDRHFVAEVGTRVLALTPESVEDFHGTYEEYLQKQGEDYLSADTRTSAATARTATSAARRGATVIEAPAPPDYQQRKERRALIAKLERDVVRLEREVADLESRLANIEFTFADPGYYQRTPRAQLEADVQRQRDLKAQLAASLEEWTQATTELESLTEV